MRIFVIVTFFILTLSGCERPQKNIFKIEGEIKGLTKGTLLLEKVRDTTLVVVDSYKVMKDGKFEMHDSILSPEFYYLRLKEFPEDYILIFAEEGIIKVNSKLEKFALAAKVVGSENHELWIEYKNMMRKFNDERLIFIREKIMAEKENNQNKIDSLEFLFKNHIKRRYLYTANYAVKHANKEIAPYLALTELYDANSYFLDTIQKSMNEKTKNSMYGKQFLEYLKKYKEDTDSLKSSNQ